MEEETSSNTLSMLQISLVYVEHALKVLKFIHIFYWLS